MEDESLLNPAEQGVVPASLQIIVHASQQITPPVSAGATPLHEAVLNGRRETVRHILSTGSKSRPMMNLDKDGLCPVHVAAKMGSCEIIEEFLLSMPESVDIRSKDYKTALHFAVIHNQFDVVRELLSKQNPKKGKQMVGYDYDKERNTAFHFAVINKVEPKIVEELLKWPGASVNAVNNEGLTPLDIVAHSARKTVDDSRRESEENFRDIKEMLEEAGGRQSGQLQGKERKIIDVDTLLASLVATVTFQAIFQIPGGTDQDTTRVEHGAARLALDPAFQAFLFYDIMAFLTSLTVITAWIFRERQPRERVPNRSVLADLSATALGMSIIFTFLAFITASFLVVIPSNLKALKAEHKKEFKKYNYIFRFLIELTIIVPLTAWARLIVKDITEFYNRRRTNPRPNIFPMQLLCIIGVVSSVIWSIFLSTDPHPIVLPMQLLSFAGVLGSAIWNIFHSK